EDAEGRAKSQSAAEACLVFLLRHRVAGLTTAGDEHLLAIGEIRRVRPQSARRHRLRNCQNPKRRETQYGDGRRDRDKSAQHGKPPASRSYSLAARWQSERRRPRGRPPFIVSDGELSFS